jgi:hypothetical protein
MSKVKSHTGPSPQLIAAPLVLATLILVSLSRPAFAAEGMAAAATNFLGALSPEQLSMASFAFDSEERLLWHFIPTEMFARNGISYKQLNTTQRDAFRSLLQSGLSESGSMTVTAIMELERVLNAIEAGGRFARDHENYMLSVFGTPDPEGTWGWRFEGHHISLHFTVVSGNLSVSAPTFLGSNPAEVRTGAQTAEQQGQRVLAAREDTARALVTSLNRAQRTQAIIADTAPNDIVTGNQMPVAPLDAVGVRAIELNAAQQNMLRELLTAYTSMMAEDIAAARWEKIQRDGFETILFAWSGSVERGQPHYYRVQGPSFLIEYDNVQNEANHIHSVWRDFDGDFGRDLLREHYQHAAH